MAAMAELEVRGGIGGTTVAIDGLAAAAGILDQCADDIADASRALGGDELRAMLSGEVSGVVRDALWQLIHALTDTRDRLVAAAALATGLGWRSRAAAARYALVERQAELRADAARSVTRALVGVVRGGGRAVGWFEDGTMDLPRLREVPHCSIVHVDDIASLMTSQSLISGQPIVRVIEVPQPDGSSAWIVQIPGTITFSPVPGAVPHDGTADLVAMVDESTVLARSALWALAEAQAARGRFGQRDPVLLSGHSLGGIAAMQIASDEELVRLHGITHVQSAGSPVGQFQPRDEVQVLSLEHRQDGVTWLDLVENPDRSNWVTVTRDLPGASGLFGKNSDAPVHGSITYRETARLAAEAAASGASPSLAEWSSTAAPFFARRLRPGDPGSAPTVRDVDVRRFQDSPAAAARRTRSRPPMITPITCE